MRRRAGAESLKFTVSVGIARAIKVFLEVKMEGFDVPVAGPVRCAKCWWATVG